ncbi:MAG: nucleotidyltransferase family protein [Patescibacteria group bacterium]|nr:nucleotidyltransferase family protein [Patescibacteria group bacterium]
MNERDILNLIKEDEWMMKILKIAGELNLPDWVIGAGFVRNKVWDHLHGFSNSKVDTNDIDLVYFDPKGNNKKEDKLLSQKLKEQTGIDWEIRNQFYMHTKNNVEPYKSTENALSQWTETATSLGVRLENGNLKLIAPYGIDDLVNLVVKPCPKSPLGIQGVRERAEKKDWFKKWPKLKFSTN